MTSAVVILLGSGTPLNQIFKLSFLVGWVLSFGLYPGDSHAASPLFYLLFHLIKHFVTTVIKGAIKLTYWLQSFENFQDHQVIKCAPEYGMFLETKYLRMDFCCLTVQHLSLWRLPTFESGLFIISFPQKVSEADLFSVAHPLIILLELSRNGHSITVGVLNEPLGWGWIQWIQGGVWKLPSCEAKHSITPTEVGWEPSHRTRYLICAWFMCVCLG